MVCSGPVKHRFFTEDLSASPVVLADREAHHALHVLRLRAGDRVELFDGRGLRALGVISRAGRSEVEVAIDRLDGPLPRPGPAIGVAFSPPKGKRLEWLLEKLTELGVAGVRPLVCERSDVTVRADRQTHQRWQAICIGAVRQSGQCRLPAIEPSTALADLPAAAGAGLLADADDDARPLAEVLAGCPSGPVEILIGPAGGWTSGEREMAREKGYRPARLGHTTLRTETAAIAVVAAVLACWDRADDDGLPHPTCLP
ncbi:MAG: 16S rRNA (uracil(1498)-N(3))-methyltransferase [Planctomycetes bacterium]|nr:16S rRNA (uracil(1498)-N(3))-methyltransferase [Planctomycetota bacterium]